MLRSPVADAVASGQQSISAHLPSNPRVPWQRLRTSYIRAQGQAHPSTLRRQTLHRQQGRTGSLAATGADPAAPVALRSRRHLSIVGPAPAPRRPPTAAAAAASGADPSGANALAGLFMAYAAQMQQQLEQQRASDNLPGADVVARGVAFHPPGTEAPLLDNVSFHLQSNQLGLVIGRSGSGKTTLLQLLAGLTEQTAGEVFISRQPLAFGQGVAGPAGAPPMALPPPTHIEQRMQQVGLVFQFPERHFLGGDLMEELTFAWPRDFKYWGQRQALAVRLQQVMEAVGLSDIPLNIPPGALSGGQQRRLALAIQLVRQPSLLLLDEPLSGLDWRARAEVVELLQQVKKHCTLLVVSHDLREIQSLVDVAWRMRVGGKMEPVVWPPGSLTDLEDEGKEEEQGS